MPPTAWNAAPWLGDEFVARFAGLCDDLRVTDPLGLLGCWMSESGLRPNAHNPGGDAAGIFQAMPSTLKNLGVTGGWQVFTRMTAAAQVPYARDYYRPYRGKLGRGELCYLATFLPAYTLRPLAELTPELVICAKNGPLGWAYAANSVFDKDGSYSITIGELGDAIRRNAHGPVWDEASRNVAEAMGLKKPAPRQLPAVYDLRTTRGIQEALVSLGFDPGEVDGMPGLRTTAALIAFQATRGLAPDGIPGPRTRAALDGGLMPTATRP